MTTVEPSPDTVPVSPHRPEAEQRVPAYAWLFVAALLSNVFAGTSGQLGLPIAPDRVLFAACFAALLLRWRSLSFRPHAVHWCMLAFAAITTVSFVLAPVSDSRSLYSLADRVIMPFLLFAVAPLAIAHERSRLLFLRALTLLGFYLGVIALGEAMELRWLVWPGYILDTRLADTTGEALRVSGPMLYAEGNGMVLGMCAVMAWLLIGHDRGLWRWVAVATIPLALVGGLLSLTRSIWLGMALATLLIAVGSRSTRKYVPYALVAALVVGAVALIAVPDLAASVLERGGTSRSLYDRVNTNDAAIRAIQTLPLTGVGWGVFLLNGTQWVRQGDAMPLTNVDIEIHNVFLSRAAELGLPAAALYVACLMLGPGRAILGKLPTPTMRGWRLALAAIVVVWFVPAMFSPIPYPLPTNLMWSVAGIVWTAVVTGSARPTAPPRRT